MDVKDKTASDPDLVECNSSIPPPSGAQNLFLREILVLALVSAAYWLSIRLGLLFTVQPEGVSSVWPANGFALAVLLIRPRRQRGKLLAVFFATSAASLLTGGYPLLPSLGFALVNMLEPALGALVLEYSCRSKITFERTREVFALLFVATVLNGFTALMGATVSMLAFNGSFVNAWAIWWAADGLGLILVAPFIVGWAASKPFLSSATTRQIVEAALLVVILAIFALLLFAPVDIVGKPLLRDYMIFPLLIWLVFRFNPCGMATMLLLFSAIAIVNTQEGYGAFSSAGQTRFEHLAALQIFLAVVTCSGLIMSAVVTGRRRADEALRESEDRYRVLFDQANDGIFLLSDKGELLSVNEAFARMHGYSAEELLHKNIKDLDTPESSSLASERIRRLLAGEALTFEVEHYHRDGHVFPLEVSGSMNSFGGKTFLQCFHRDITERKRVEEALRESEAVVRKKLQAILDPEGDIATLSLSDIIDCQALQSMMDEFYRLTHIGIGILDVNGKVLVGAGWQEICTKFHRIHPDTLKNCHESDVFLSKGAPEGTFKAYRCKNNMWDLMTPLEIGGRHLGNVCLGQFFYEDEIPDYDLFRRQARRYGFDEEEYIAALDRVPRWSREKVEATMAFYAKLAGMISSLSYTTFKLAGTLSQRDAALHELKAREEALRNSNELFSLFIRHSPIYAFIKEVKTSGSRVLQASDNFHQMIGDSGLNMVGKTMEELFPPDVAAKITADDWSVVEKGEILKLDEDFNGRKYTTIKFPIVQGGKTLLAGYIIDITERRKAEEDRQKMEEQLRQSQKMEAIGQLAGGIAHDFNNQLMGIMGYAELLYSHLDDPSLRNDAESILRSARRASDLTRDLLAFSRKGKYLNVPVNVNKIIEEVISLLEHSIDKRIEIKRILNASPVMISGDPTQIQNALLNLAINAKDALPSGGEILFTTGKVKMEDVFSVAEERRNAVKGDYMKISVIDDGIGIDDETKEHMFEPFFTTKQPGKGTGMGLASVYGTVKGHNGAIHVDSKLGEGTVFSMFFPLIVDKAELESPEAATGKTIRKSKILLVDDDEMVRNIVSSFLSSFGHEVVNCRDGLEAVELYRHSWKEIDLVILDMMMPRMNGKDAFLEMQKINKDVKTLLISGYSIDGEAQSLLDAGIKGFIQKPFGKKLLAETLEKVLSS
ncbi:MAG: PocR ligand-binding domain-containing protein [Victivallales bacterium]